MPIGYCYNCDEHVERPERIFCKQECGRDFEKRERAIAWQAFCLAITVARHSAKGNAGAVRHMARTDIADRSALTALRAPADADDLALKGR